MTISIVYNPVEVSTLGSEYLNWKRNNKEFGLPFFSAKMRNRVYPMFPGELMSIIARPGHAKTSLMMMWARQRGKWLHEHKMDKRMVIYATWEQSIEELQTFYVASEQHISITKMAKGELSDEEWQRVEKATASRISEPLWFIGHSMIRKSGRKPITTETLAQAIESVGEQGYDVDSVFVDYLQRISPIGGFDNPVMAYSGIMDGLKNFALGYGVPMVVGVQASREVEALKIQVPEMHHAQWTSNIEQSSDRVLSTVRPQRYRKVGESFGSHTVSTNDLLVTVLKQKLGEANFVEWLSFNPIYNELNDMEIAKGGVGE